MFCSNCGSRIADGSKFCSNCGAKQQTGLSRTSIDLEMEQAPETGYRKKSESVQYSKSNDFDWSSVIEESHKKKIPTDLKSPWDSTGLEEETSAVTENAVKKGLARGSSLEEEVFSESKASSSKNTGRTLTYIETLMAERAAQEKKSSTSKKYETFDEVILPQDQMERTQGYTDLQNDILSSIDSRQTDLDSQLKAYNEARSEARKTRIQNEPPQSFVTDAEVEAKSIPSEPDQKFYTEADLAQELVDILGDDNIFLKRKTSQYDAFEVEKPLQVEESSKAEEPLGVNKSFWTEEALQTEKPVQEPEPVHQTQVAYEPGILKDESISKPAEDDYLVYEEYVPRRRSGRTNSFDLDFGDSDIGYETDEYQEQKESASVEKASALESIIAIAEESDQINDDIIQKSEAEAAIDDIVNMYFTEDGSDRDTRRDTLTEVVAGLTAFAKNGSVTGDDVETAPEADRVTIDDIFGDDFLNDIVDDDEAVDALVDAYAEEQPEVAPVRVGSRVQRIYEQEQLVDEYAAFNDTTAEQTAEELAKEIESAVHVESTTKDAIADGDPEDSLFDIDFNEEEALQFTFETEEDVRTQLKALGFDFDEDFADFESDASAAVDSKPLQADSFVSDNAAVLLTTDGTEVISSDDDIIAQLEALGFDFEDDDSSTAEIEEESMLFTEETMDTSDVDDADKVVQLEDLEVAMTPDELERDLFGEVIDSDDVEATRKIEKFYTLYRKNEEFQKLLDDEYRKLKGDDLYEEPLTVDGILAAEQYEESEHEVAHPIEVEEKKASVEEAYLKEKQSETKPEVKLEIETKIKSEEAAVAVSGLAEPLIDEDEEDERSFGDSLLTVLVIVVAVLLAVLLAVLIILNVAPDSAIADAIGNAIDNFANLFAVGDVSDEILL